LLGDYATESYIMTAAAQLPASAYSASDSDAAVPTLFAQSRSFDRMTWAGRQLSLRVL
jgi:hypothetical protein